MSKDLSTFCTLERFFYSMLPAMQDKIRVVGEGLPTFTALIRPLPTVNVLVLGKIRPAVEGLPTLQALLRPLSCVDHLVLKEMSTLYEGLPTHCTLIGLHRVDLLVSSKEVFLLNTFPQSLHLKIVLSPS